MSIDFANLPNSLPGYDLIAPGYEDLKNDHDTIPALLLSIACKNLSRNGISLPKTIQTPENKLYLKLQEKHGDEAHSKYNSLIRLLISFEKTIPCVI